MLNTVQRAQASVLLPSFGSCADLFLRIAIFLALVPGAWANCFIDDDGFENCNNGLSNGVRIGIGLAGAAIFLVILGILSYRRRQRLQQYYLSYLPPQDPPPPPPPQPQAYYASYTEYSKEPYGAHRGNKLYEEQPPQVVGVYSMYSVQSEGSGAPPPRYPPNVYSNDMGGAPSRV